MNIVDHQNLLRLKPKQSFDRLSIVYMTKPGRSQTLFQYSNDIFKGSNHELFTGSNKNRCV